MRVQQEQQRKLAERTIQHAISTVCIARDYQFRVTYRYLFQRIIHNALTRWTNRVIELKLRELEVAQKYDNSILMCVPLVIYDLYLTVLLVLAMRSKNGKEFVYDTSKNTVLWKVINTSNGKASLMQDVVTKYTSV